MNDDKHKIISVGQIDINADKFSGEPVLDDLPLLPTRDLVLFPGVTFPISLGRQRSIETAEWAESTGTPIGIICQISAATEHPTVTDLFKYGVIGDVLRVFEIPDGPKTAIVRARGKFRLTGPGDGKTCPGALSGSVTLVKEPSPRSSDKEFLALASAVKDAALNILRKTMEGPNDLAFNIENYPDPVGLINLVATHTPFPTGFKQELLKQNRPKERAFKLLTQLARNEQMVDLTHDIQERTKQNMSQQQRNAFLQQQMEAIRQELYGDEDDAAMFREKSLQVNFPDDVRHTFEREVDKLGRLNPQSPDYSVQYSYLETLLDLPWGKPDELSTDLKGGSAITESFLMRLTK